MEFNFILVGVTVILIGFFIKKYFFKINDYWEIRGVPTLKGALPFFGNTLSVFLFRKEFSRYCKDIYNSHRNNSMVGFYQNHIPKLLIRDPELVKTVLISSFPNFHINFLAINPDFDKLLAETPFFSYGEKWKNRRNILSNALMSSKKLKDHCGALTKICEKFSKYLEENIKKSNGVYEIDTKDLFSRYTGEVVAGVPFGIEGDFFINGSGPNSFKEAIFGVFDNTFLNIIMYTVIFFTPALNKILGFSFLPKRLDHFFRRIISQVITARKKDGIARDDFLQVILEAHTNDDGIIDEAGVTSAATAFFIAAYETSAITLIFFAYQLAINPEIQNKVRQEVKEMLEKHNQEICYESLNEMTYMEQALNESMRLYPAVGFLVKRCSQQCKLIGNDGIECLVEPGTDILISVQALHEDSAFWENPLNYDPERFNPETKNDRPRTAFLPFGEGPRICVGMRFAMLQMKSAIATILQRYSIELSTKTKIPLEFKHAALTTVDGGVWIKLRPL